MKLIDDVYFDFADAQGDTINEKAESLWLFLFSQEAKFTGKGKTILMGMESEGLFSAMEMVKLFIANTSSPVSLYVSSIQRYIGHTNHWEMWSDPIISFDRLTMLRGGEYINVYFSNFTT